MSDKRQLIRQAFSDASSRVPLKRDDELVAAAIPGGGDWECVVVPGAICRSIIFGRRTEVAIVNPRGDLDDETEGQIAMAIRALPALDAALRSIIVLAENPENAPLIREMAVALVEYIERPAPPVPEPEDEDAA